MKKVLNSILYTFFLIIIIYLPFMRLLDAFLASRGFSSDVVFWTTHWYLIVAALLSIIYFFLRTKDLKALWPAWLLLFVGVISLLFFSPNLSRGIEGFWFTLLPILFLLLASFRELDKNKIKKLFSAYLVVALLLAIWGLIELFLPINYWANFGLSGFGFGQFGFGHFSFGVLYQSASLIGGPNQLASYLLPAVFISLYRSNLPCSSSLSDLGVDDRQAGEVRTSLKNRRILRIFYLSILLLAIVFTFSRSAWIGLIISYAFFIKFYLKNKLVKNVSVIFILLLLIFSALSIKYLPAVRDILLHTGGGEAASSTSAHVSALGESASEIQSRLREPLKLLFGSGLGTAGPLVLKYGDGIISESWYFQILFELGIVGLALWIWLIISILVKYFRSNPALFLATLSVSITALFLHTFADNPAVAITLMIMIGISNSSTAQ